MTATTRRGRARALGVASVLTAMVCAVMPAVAAADTYTADDGWIEIPDASAVDGRASPYPSTVTVSGVPGRVTGVTVTVRGFSHSRPSDVDLLLAGPQGDRALLLSDAGGAHPVAGIDLVFDDAAVRVISEDAVLEEGVFAPADFGAADTFPADAPAGPYPASFEQFAGSDPNGAWKLYAVDDDATEDALGEIEGWSLTVDTAVQARPIGLDAERIAQAILANPSQLASAAFADGGQAVTATPNAFAIPLLTPGVLFDNGTAALAGFPVASALSEEFAILTTGDAGLADNTPQTLAADSGVSNGGGSPAGRGDTAYDVTTLALGVVVPADASCLALDYRFLSEEFPEFVGTEYNDAFIAEVDQSTWTTSGSSVTAPRDFATDTGGEGVTVNGVGPVAVAPAEADDTTYDAATGLVTTKTPITPGAHTIYLSILDQGDDIYDSAVFLDDLRFIAEPAATCRPPFVAETPVGTDPVVEQPPAEQPPPLVVQQPSQAPVVPAGTPTARPVVPAGPSNVFTLGSRIQFKRGATVLTVTVPGPGVLAATQATTARRAVAAGGRRKRPPALVKGVRLKVAKAGRVRLTIKPTKAGRKVLARRRSLRVKVRVTYTPTGGRPRSAVKTITIRRAKR